jgi:hypothetical protein
MLAVRPSPAPRTIVGTTARPPRQVPDSTELSAGPQYARTYAAGMPVALRQLFNERGISLPRSGASINAEACWTYYPSLGPRRG